MGGKRYVKLSQEFFKDLAWFKNFLTQFISIVYYDTRPVQTELHLDACLTRLGGIFANQCYALPISKGYNNYSIVHLEMLNILVALKVWAHQWANKKVRIKCDNMAVVEVFKTKDVMLATCARNIWMLKALFNISIHIEYIPGKQNVVADLLSRFKFDQSSWDLLKIHVSDPVWIPTHADLMCLNYNI